MKATYSVKLFVDLPEISTALRPRIEFDAILLDSKDYEFHPVAWLLCLHDIYNKLR